MDDKVQPLFGDRQPPKSEPKSKALDWQVTMASGEVLHINGHMVLNGMIVAILEDPDDQYSVKFYANSDTVEYVIRA